MSLRSIDRPSLLRRAVPAMARRTCRRISSKIPATRDQRIARTVRARITLSARATYVSTNSACMRARFSRDHHLHARSVAWMPRNAPRARFDIARRACTAREPIAPRGTIGAHRRAMRDRRSGDLARGRSCARPVPVRAATPRAAPRHSAAARASRGTVLCVREPRNAEAVLQNQGLRVRRRRSASVVVQRTRRARNSAPRSARALRHADPRAPYGTPIRARPKERRPAPLARYRPTAAGSAGCPRPVRTHAPPSR